jgi:hypothetical protein
MIETSFAVILILSWLSIIVWINRLNRKFQKNITKNVCTSCKYHKLEIDPWEATFKENVCLHPNHETYYPSYVNYITGELIKEVVKNNKCYTFNSDGKCKFFEIKQ